ncbi:hypothetical protein C5167_042748 [Papaver somniferum]|uniref:Uncharacterized protein n=1 Tax=Papaver somniferum TaxID=3469 RepID=A0A4Y7L7B5_PAPSO|nr:hypothetical protein C5167_042748 [Papaver somniferum]
MLVVEMKNPLMSLISPCHIPAPIAEELSNGVEVHEQLNNEEELKVAKGPTTHSFTDFKRFSVHTFCLQQGLCFGFVEFEQLSSMQNEMKVYSVMFSGVDVCCRRWRIMLRGRVSLPITIICCLYWKHNNVKVLLEYSTTGNHFKLVDKEKWPREHPLTRGVSSGA